MVFFNPEAYAAGFRSCSGLACNGYTIAGSVTSSTAFVRFEQVVQVSSLASATVVYANGSVMAIGTYTGTPNGTNNWVGQTSGAIFTPNSGAVPVAATATIVAQSPIAWIGNAPWSNAPGSTSSCSSSDATCCMTMNGLVGTGTGTGGGVCTQGAGDVIENMAFEGSGYAGVSGPACWLCGEGSGYWNDGTAVSRMTGWDYATWSDGGPSNAGVGTSSNQNHTLANNLEAYAATSNGRMVCSAGLNTALCAEKISLFLYNGWQRQCLGRVTVNGGPWLAAIDIEGQGRPDSATGPSLAGAGSCSSEIHTQSLTGEHVIVGQQMPTMNVKISNIHGATPAPINVLISCDFNGGATCPLTAGGTGLTTPAGAGNQTSDIETEMTVGRTTTNIQNQITGRNWTDDRIQWYLFHDCPSGDSSCTGTGITEISSSTQFTSVFGGGVQSSAFSYPLANNGTTGTVLDNLAILTGAPSTATVATTSSIGGGVIGLVVAGSGTSGNATILWGGVGSCAFDATTVTAGDYVQASTSIGGDCHDAGSSRPATGQIIGRALTSGSASTVESVVLQMTQ